MIAAAAVIFTANAQNRAAITKGADSGKPFAGQIHKSPMAAGDTLMYMPLLSTFVNPTDIAAFTTVIEDIDGLPTYNVGYDPDWGIYYSTDSSLDGSGGNMSSNWYQPWEVPAPAGTDTAFYWHATSWFNPAGQANNWLEFGPLTIPATGANLQWRERFNPWGTDGYQVMVSASFGSPYSFADFSDPAIFTRTDSHPSADPSLDSVWQLKSVNIPASYNGQVVIIAFDHNAFDMDVIYLDEITLIEGPAGVHEVANGAKLSQNIPNPCSNVATINYELEKNAVIALSVYDVTGKLVMNQELGSQAIGSHSVKLNTSDLAGGVYYYSLSVDQTATQAMKMVIVK